ncbi:MAG: Gfo/Idh/MocA family oxidoreductase [Lentisphaeria bacterium]|nr:Gfo/Idh/MocA family oxidoreductase [Lentisphaeria bacterium]MDY0176528.1 Gfo/Idh/MocA family oxidoreductase [Lentisphaeria bacterium]
MQNLKVAVIGLDTSHSVELPRLCMAADLPADKKVDGLTITACQRFETPFQNKEGLDKRQEQLEAWGIKVTECFDEAIADCDAVMIEINDPALHLPYFEKVAPLGKPIFLDKPLAGSLQEGRKILELAKKYNARVFSCSSLPLTPTIAVAIDKLEGEEVKLGQTFGALGTAPAGESLIWYGVHSFEMLQRLMGCGAEKVFAVENEVSVTTNVVYPEGRRGLIESIRGMWRYGGRVQSQKKAEFFHVDNSRLYFYLLSCIRDFFHGGPAPIAMEQTFEGQAMMCAALESLKTGTWAEVEKL